ncbi:hypothetical protein MK851_15425 [Tenacibaculum sp. 1B UA]|nr:MULTISPECIES: hypothetical protein [unclassified Tenacibaculum]MDO6676896.1 hypothetical protein [Tenacibaculum sp. 1_MG-2023]MDX8555005.1 hypothetical protein [Tenacibaculum sp. 1B UA]
MKKNTIIKIAKGKITLSTKNDISIKAKNINSLSKTLVNETGKEGIVFK